MPNQYAATIITPIADGQTQPLTDLLLSIGGAIETNPHVTFARLTSAHFMSWVVVDRPDYGPFLFLELNVDEPIPNFLRFLLATAGPGIDLIYGHCRGYPSAGSRSHDEVVAYLLKGDVGYDCYYVGKRGLTAQRIRQERELRDRIEEFLDLTGNEALADKSPAQVGAIIRRFVDNDPMLVWSKEIPSRPFLVQHRDEVFSTIVTLLALIVVGTAAVVLLEFGFWALLIAVGVIALLIGGFLAILRRHEETDSVAVVEPNHNHIDTVVSFENKITQNHFASIADVKPGLFRQVVLRSVLKVIHIAGAIYFNQGALGRIPSIHFARWVVIDGGRKLLFLSNYDGSWENYLDDFIDKASNGLTAVWSNTVGFPRSRYLVQGGAEDEFLFKTLARHSQVRSLVWYSAYEDLTVRNVTANAAIREGISTPMDGAVELDWLRNF